MYLDKRVCNIAVYSQQGSGMLWKSESNRAWGGYGKLFGPDFKNLNLTNWSA